MKKQRKRIKKEIHKNLYTHKRNRDKDGRIILNMTVKDDTNFLSDFSIGDSPVINSKVADFIEKSTYAILPDEPLLLNIYSDCIDDKEKEEYTRAIKEYYTEHYLSNKRELKRNRVLAIILALLGTLILASAFIIEHFTASVFWTEVVDIIAWAILWEAIDISAFKNKKIRVNNSRYLSYLSMKIEYHTQNNT